MSFFKQAQKLLALKNAILIGKYSPCVTQWLSPDSLYTIPDLVHFFNYMRENKTTCP